MTDPSAAASNEASTEASTEAPNEAPTEAPFERAPTWRKQPYRLFFPLGLLHVWAGVSPWLLIALGNEGHNTRVYHSIAQIQGFMLCFALGFLFTMIPRRTRTEAPSVVEMLLGLICPVGITVCAAFEWLAVSQWFWFALALNLVVFVVRRARRAASGKSPPPGFVWLPIAILMGLVGAVLFGVYGALAAREDLSDAVRDQLFRIHTLAQLFLLQGMFVGLVAGVGSMVIPLMTRGESPGPSSSADRRKRLLHVGAALLFVGTFFLQVYLPYREGHHAGYLARAGVCGLVLLWSGRIFRPPSQPGANRWLIWLAAWMLPLGYLVAGALPPHQFQAGLHVVFLGCFATLAFAVAAHVSLAHGGRKDLLAGWSWPIVGYGACFYVALIARILMQLDIDRYLLWLGTAAGSFLLGTLSWAVVVLPAMFRSPPRQPAS